MKRNTFLKTAALGSMAGMLPIRLRADMNNTKIARDETIRFGIITDIHQDYTFDAPKRLKAFVEDMNDKKSDFIIQLGDFCVPKEKNNDFMKIWNQFQGNKYHVIGNHEFDEGCTLEQIMKFFGMSNNYYSFDLKGFHFVILDGNGKIPNKPEIRYPSYFHEQQLTWLENDLNKTQLPIVVFCHQGLDHNGVYNREAVRILFQNINEKAGFDKVKAVFSGHHHLDYQNEINGIHYIQINSATYRWLGNHYNNTSFEQEQYKTHPLIRHMGYYEEPLWAWVEINDKNELIVNGRNSNWKGLSPQEMGEKSVAWDYQSSTKVSNRKIQL